MGYRVGVDVGGTFTDLICVTPDGRDRARQDADARSTTSRSGVMNGLEPARRPLRALARRVLRAARHPRARHHHRRQHDDRDERRGHRPARHRGPPRRDRAAPLPQGSRSGTRTTRARSRSPAAGRASRSASAWTSRARSCTRSTRRRCAAACSGCKQLGVRSIAVMYLFSFVNPEHERRTREIVLEEFPDVEHISLSHEVMPRGPEFERVSTTLVNAYVAPRIAHYTSHLQDELRRAGYGGPLLIMQSTGGVMPPDYVARRAVTLLASGPTGGVMGATLAANRADVGDFVAVDMGGTSFDICLVRHGQPADQDRLELALPLLHRPARWSTCRASARAAARSPACARARCSSGPSRRARRPGRSVTAAAARGRPSPTPTRCSATSPPTGSRAAACTSTSPRPRPRSSTTSPSRSASTSPRPRGASSAS